MVPAAPGIDRWHATIRPDAVGEWTFTVEAFDDPYLTWRDAVTKKIDAGQGAADLANDLADGAPSCSTAAAKTVPADRRAEACRGRRGAARRRRCRCPSGSAPRWTWPTCSGSTRCASWSPRPDAAADLGRPASGRCSPPGTSSSPAPRAPSVDGDRPAGPPRHLRHRGARGCRPSREMGFDVLYLPPIHPIGRVNRKGRNNALVAGADDVGSPWAIGAAEGGHDAIHPRAGHAGGLPGVRRRAPATPGLEVAMDLALQCAPDHPWVTEHPEWFTTLRRRHHRVRREPAEEVPGHLPAQLRQRPRGHPRRDAAGRAALGRRRASRSSGWTTRTPSRSTSGTG